MRALALAVSLAFLSCNIAEAQNWDGRWRGRADPPVNADVILRIARGKPAFFSWGGGRIGVLNVYVDVTPDHFKFSTGQGAAISLTRHAPGAVKMKYWSAYYGDATATLYNTPCSKPGPGGICMDP